MSLAGSYASILLENCVAERHAVGLDVATFACHGSFDVAEGPQAVLVTLRGAVHVGPGGTASVTAFVGRDAHPVYFKESPEGSAEFTHTVAAECSGGRLLVALHLLAWSPLPETEVSVTVDSLDVVLVAAHPPSPAPAPGAAPRNFGSAPG
ncbi:hypothetical protein [Sorangium sp. So ce128]|uniref:hypothetical protein n=1 Tax=Sorangium sp. So ce128 TaxID=3133281 RepID=UPI003F5EED1F